MKQTIILSTAAFCLLLGGSTMASAQSQRATRSATPPSKAPPHTAVSSTEQHQRVQQQQQRVTQYQQHLGKQLPVVRQQTAQLQTQKRTAQVRVQQKYATQLQQQQQQLVKQRARTSASYSKDPYITSPPTYRYKVNGALRETNRYGVNVLQLAVSDGYQEGYEAGSADRADRWASNYENSPAYEDATYGYSGEYVDLGDYSYYFREGFQRGYEDGYDDTFQYGSLSSGRYSVLGSVMSGILGLEPIL